MKIIKKNLENNQRNGMIQTLQLQGGPLHNSRRVWRKRACGHSPLRTMRPHSIAERLPFPWNLERFAWRHRDETEASGRANNPIWALPWGVTGFIRCIPSRDSLGRPSRTEKPERKMKRNEGEEFSFDAFHVFVNNFRY